MAKLNLQSLQGMNKPLESGIILEDKSLESQISQEVPTDEPSTIVESVSPGRPQKISLAFLKKNATNSVSNEAITLKIEEPSLLVSTEEKTLENRDEIIQEAESTKISQESSSSEETLISIESEQEGVVVSETTISIVSGDSTENKKVSEPENNQNVSLSVNQESAELFPNYDFAKELDLKEDFMLPDEWNNNLQVGMTPEVVSSDSSEKSSQKEDNYVDITARVSPEDVAQSILSEAAEQKSDSIPEVQEVVLLEVPLPEEEKKASEEVSSFVGKTEIDTKQEQKSFLSIMSTMNTTIHSFFARKHESISSENVDQSKIFEEKEDIKMKYINLFKKHRTVAFAAITGVFVFGGAGIFYVASIPSLPTTPNPPEYNQDTLPKDTLVPHDIKKVGNSWSGEVISQQYVEGVDFFVNKIKKKNIPRKKEALPSVAPQNDEVK